MPCLRQALGAAFIAVIFASIQPAAGAVLAQQSPVPAPSEPKAAAPATPSAPAESAPAVPKDPFGDEVTLEPKTIVTMSGNSPWEGAFETLVDAFKSIDGYLEKQKITPSGQPIVIYTEADDTGFHYQVGVPIAEAPKNQPRGDLSVSTSPAGKTLKFVHRGTYQDMDTLYEAITDYLDEKRIETEDMFIEEYVTDPVKTAPDKLIVNVYVPLKKP